MLCPPKRHLVLKVFEDFIFETEHCVRVPHETKGQVI